MTLPFEINEPSAMIYASVKDLSQGMSMSLSIIHLQTGTSVALSKPSKYFSQIHPVSLTKGKYSLVIRPTAETTEQQSGQPDMVFTLDFLYEKREE